MSSSRTVRMFATLTIAAAGFGATCNRQQVAHTVLDVAQTACVLLHDQIEDEAVLAKTCDVAEALIPELRKLVLARKDASAKKAAAAPSSGCPAASTTTSASAAPSSSVKAVGK